MFKTKGFSSNNSLKRRGVIVDAPDLPPEECEFYITSAGIADTDKVELSDDGAGGEDFDIETLYEESGDEADGSKGDSSTIPLTKVKGIGKGTADSLEGQGIASIDDLMAADPDDLASKISGISSKKVLEMQENAKALISS